MIANQAEVQKKSSDETLLQSSAVGDSKANVIAERAVQAISEQVRDLRRRFK